MEEPPSEVSMYYGGYLARAEVPVSRSQLVMKVNETL